MYVLEKEMNCSECNSDKVEDTQMGLVCMTCGFEMGEVPEESNYKISTVPIDKRFNLFLDHFCGSVAGEVLERIRPLFLPEMSMKDLRNLMKKLDLQLYYDSLPAVYMYLKTGKCYQINSQQRQVLINDYCQFVKTFKTCIKGRNNLPRLAQILEALLKKNKIPYDKDMFIEMKIESRKKAYERDFELVFQELGWK